MFDRWVFDWLHLSKLSQMEVPQRLVLDLAAVATPTLAQGTIDSSIGGAIAQVGGCMADFEVIEEIIKHVASQGIVLKVRQVAEHKFDAAQLTDFDLSKGDMEATMTMGVGTFRRIAPEVIEGHIYSNASDIYSYDTTHAKHQTRFSSQGMILSEFATT
ncbi:Aste57867_23170 [Aphanomyces stellatus]|uniref:Aste57867_23170 protein n=1 Tax=Aphanomyces stellatus TaxID=120398 RepID=A0A485LM82_9STRA|nr:hypothetical protein As57867_023099 [Aphanomyces stellatus]VFT99818.1 Aste57867_23170 [Aphanomyces stellatus]